VEGRITVKERKFQTELKKSLQLDGGFSIKLNPEWSVGIPDMFLLHDGQVALIETKVSNKNLVIEDGIVKKGSTVEILMTPKQRATLRAVQAAGGVAGWCVAYRANDEWYAVFGIDSEAVRVIPTSSTNIILKGKHSKWDVPSMIRQLANPDAIWDNTKHKEDSRK